MVSPSVGVHSSPPPPPVPSASPAPEPPQNLPRATPDVVSEPLVLDTEFLPQLMKPHGCRGVHDSCNSLICTRWMNSTQHQGPAETARHRSPVEQLRAVVESARAQANTPLTEMTSQRTKLNDLAVRYQTAIQQRDAAAATAQIDCTELQRRCHRFSSSTWGGASDSVYRSL